MSSSDSINEPQKTIDSLHLYHTALASLSLPIPPPLPLPTSLPPSKHIPNTRFLVDSFRTPASTSSAVYFLSHFHSDHYSGLSPTWSHGVVFCSPTTALLLTRVLRIPSPFVFPLPLRDPVLIDGVEVTLSDANHCPGAVQFLFKVPNKNNLKLIDFEYYVHTGDFRFCASMREDFNLCRFVGCDAVFLDTTYCNPKFVFPSQEESVDYIVNVIERIGGVEFRSLNKSVLFVVATYVVGKERILVEIARRCNRKVYVDARKMEVLRVLGYGESGLFTEDESESDVHVVGWNVLGETWPYFRPNFVKMKEIMVERGYSRVVGFVPTGWTYEVKRNKFAVRLKDEFEIHLVPYSEHSNYEELREYVKFLRPRRVIPTVGVDVEKLDSKHANKMQKHFSGLVDEMANKKEFLMGFFRGPSEGDVKVEGNVVPGDDEGLDQEKEVKTSPVKDLEINSPRVVSNSSSALQEHDLKISSMPIVEEEEKMLQELSDSLPLWVTREQKLDLISSSGMNVVEAVSSFYERETEFHEQVFAGKFPVSASQTASFDNSGSLSEPVSIKCSFGSLSAPSSQNFHLPKTKSSIKSSASSPGKRKGITGKMSSKKVKNISKLESGGSKQSTITRFFSKVSINVSQYSMAASISEEGTVNENLLNDDIKSYREEIDEFICIIDGDESSRSYAATILERTRGDINRALDMHYGNSKGDLGDNVKNLLPSGNLVLPQSHASECSSSQEKIVLEEAKHMTDQSVCGSTTENVDTTLVSLPSEEYDPIVHACWRAGQPAPYIHLARAFDLVEAEKGKIKATSMLCNMFRRSSAAPDYLSSTFTSYFGSCGIRN